MIQRPVPDNRIAAYVAEVSQPGIPYVSTSHRTLSRLYDEHGVQVVQMLLEAHWAEMRIYDRAMTEALEART